MPSQYTKLASTDILRFRECAERYVAFKEWQVADQEDIVSMMTIEALENPSASLRVRYVYRHAVDALYPRIMINGIRGRTYYRLTCIDDLTSIDDDMLLDHNKC